MDFIYTLVDDKEIPFYVGITNNPNQRLQQHLDGKSGGPTTCAHVKGLLSQGVRIGMRIVEPLYEGRKAAIEREKFWIRAYRDKGVFLTNALNMKEKAPKPVKIVKAKAPKPVKAKKIITTPKPVKVRPEKSEARKPVTKGEIEPTDPIVWQKNPHFPLTKPNGYITIDEAATLIGINPTAIRCYFFTGFRDDGAIREGFILKKTVLKHVEGIRYFHSEQLEKGVVSA